MRYVEADILSEEDRDVEEVNNMASKIATPTPNKRPKVLKNEKIAKAVEEVDLQENSKSKSAKKETKKKTNKKKKGRKGRRKGCQNYDF